MKKKKNASKRRSHIKHKQFDNQSISSLESHKRAGGILTPPLATIPNTASSSWRDEGINDVLWAVILRGNLEQKECLDCFRRFVANARENIEDRKNTFLTHAVIAAFPDELFDIWVKPLLKEEKTKNILRALLFFENLPDRKHWLRHLDLPDPKIHSEYLMRGIAECFDHQSQAATDVRWLKIVYFIIVSERLVFPKDYDIDELRLYPDHGDQRKVRPSIRALEMSLRGIHEGISPVTPPEIKEKVAAPWHDAFWKECFEKTPCRPIEKKSSKNQ